MDPRAEACGYRGVPILGGSQVRAASNVVRVLAEDAELNIVLIGFSGTGKSTVGRALATRLSWDFVDTDLEVERGAGMPIYRIFAEKGEAVFRQWESQAVRAALEGGPRVVSVGGGAVVDPANREIMKRRARVILLEAEPESIHRRLVAQGGSEPRPLLQGDNPIERIRSLKASRELLYKETADTVVSTEGLELDAVVRRLAADIEAADGSGAVERGLTGKRVAIQAAAGRYHVVVGRGLLGKIGTLLREAGLEGNIRLITDETVDRLYGDRVLASLQNAGYACSRHAVPAGEPSKSLEATSRLYDWLVDDGTERRDLVLALGGGVVGDLAGYVAATFLRGLRLVQVPTSLLAQVDSSVGGKVAVNHARGKNLIGAFYPPSLVVADLDTLRTLPERELPAALAEVVKMGMILDAQLFELVERTGARLMRPETPELETIVTRCVELKGQVVEADEKESGLRAILNYGHTIGHAVEAASGYDRYRHGEAVALGMMGAAAIARDLGMVGAEVVRRQGELLRDLGLPARCPELEGARLLEAMSHDKKSSLGKLTWVLPDRIGHVRVRRDVPEDLVQKALRSLTGAEVAE